MRKSRANTNREFSNKSNEGIYIEADEENILRGTILKA